MTIDFIPEKSFEEQISDILGENESLRTENEKLKTENEELKALLEKTIEFLGNVDVGER